jgi:hypothetical protein
MYAAPGGIAVLRLRYLVNVAGETIDKLLRGVGKYKAISFERTERSVLREMASSENILCKASGERRQSLTRISATPGQKQNAYAQALPLNATRLAGAVRSDILSTTKDICDSRFWTNMFLTFWCIESASISDPLDSNEVVDRDFGTGGLTDRGVSFGVADVKGGTFHSGLIMIPARPSRKAGRSVPVID